jgi:hypothetical protein
MFCIAEPQFQDRKSFFYTPKRYSVRKFFPKYRPGKTRFAKNYKRQITSKVNRGLGALRIESVRRQKSREAKALQAPFVVPQRFGLRNRYRVSAPQMGTDVQRLSSIYQLNSIQLTDQQFSEKPVNKFFPLLRSTWTDHLQLQSQQEFLPF